MRNKAGITLIALVITIVVLIILTGVVISLTLGDNGIFSKALKAKEDYAIAAAREQIELKIAQLQVEKEGQATLGELVEYLKDDTYIEYTVALEEIVASLTSDITIGDAKEIYVVYNKYQFKVNNKFKVQYISKVTVSQTLPGDEVNKPEGYGDNVKAILDEDGNVIPVPIDFYYVGGTKDKGVVISDEKEDKYENGKDKTTAEYASKLIGNQFVWIPVDTIGNYARTNFAKRY